MTLIIVFKQLADQHVVLPEDDMVNGQAYGSQKRSLSKNRTRDKVVAASLGDHMRARNSFELLASQ